MGSPRAPIHAGQYVPACRRDCGACTSTTSRVTSRGDREALTAPAPLPERTPRHRLTAPTEQTSRSVRRGSDAAGAGVDPRLVKRHAFRLHLVLLAVVAAVALPTASAQASSRSCAIAGVYATADVVPTNASLRKARETLCLLNRERAQHGLRPLRLSKRLGRASLRHSRNMVRKHFFQHGNFVARILNARYVTRRQAWSLGENIAWGTGSLATPAQTVRAWMHSPGHRANILNRRFRDIGIGIVLGAPVIVPVSSGAATYTTDFGVKG
jgi:uncharacterized protein YkwD